MDAGNLGRCLGPPRGIEDCSATPYMSCSSIHGDAPPIDHLDHLDHLGHLGHLGHLDHLGHHLHLNHLDHHRLAKDSCSAISRGCGPMKIRHLSSPPPWVSAIT